MSNAKLLHLKIWWWFTSKSIKGHM